MLTKGRFMLTKKFSRALFTNKENIYGNRYNMKLYSKIAYFNGKHLTLINYETIELIETIAQHFSRLTF